jgi:hypothetical protein
MAIREGEQIDTLPVQVYGWDYTNGVPVKIAVDADGKIEVA